MKSFFLFIWEVIKIVVIALAIVLPVRYFLFQPFFVSGQSMEPSFENGDYLIVDEISYRFRAPERGEVLVFRYPGNPSERYIKRIIGLPEETIEIQDGEISVYKDEKKLILNEANYLPPSLRTPGEVDITLGENEYFVLGDNRYNSSDSRRWGPLPKENIIGRVVLRAWPITAFAKFEAPAY